MDFMSPGSKRFEQLIQKLNQANKLIRSWELKGGISAQVIGLEILQPTGKTVRMIARQHGKNDLKRNPNIAADEYRLLEILKNEGLPVPAPYYFEQAEENDTKPCLLIEYVEGMPEFLPSNLADYIYQVAATLVHIHRLECEHLDLSFLPKQLEVCEKLIHGERVKMDETLNQGLIRNALQSTLPLPSLNKAVILHGDYWPGNILFIKDKLASVIDWEDAAIGDPLADLANGQLEILFHFGVKAMDDFTHHYASLRPNLNLTNLPFWQLYAALRLSSFPKWGLEKSKEKIMWERYTSFVLQALKRVSGC
ncbi:phosphotransferase [Peribacillus sp. SI8-4]|uniref:phosphotransferase family protein n=1 Tax=Peribacillus sp. SI8-4 TaxID=3048009 RepID=UPI00255420D3|nr:phosphotransferase [Peribacillus sp. SI8-4]